MTQYIDKAAVMAEIRKRLLPVIRDKHYDEWEEGKDSERIAILDIIDSLDVKEMDSDKRADVIGNIHEKADFVGDGFIECKRDFLDFKEGNTYWLEYIGDDKYNVRSDNLLGKTYHITPCQLYTVFKKQ